MKKFLHSCGQYLLDAVFPRRCVLCGKLIESSKQMGLCDLCLWQDYQSDEPLNEEGSGRCSLKYEDRLQQALYRMKYNGCRSYGHFFGAWMAEEGKEWAEQMGFDRMTAVPLAKKRMKSRGYNQAEVIARELSRLCRVPYEELLKRQRETRLQKGLGEQLREKNMAGAFEVLPFEGELKRICVVDDIYTTGSTLRECIRVLQERWPEAKVYYWTLARRNIERL